MQVVHLRRESYTHYIGRPSVFGNPFTMPPYSRLEAIRLFEGYARSSDIVLNAIRNLPEDAVLGCFCAPLSCHGDVIITLWKALHAIV